MNLRNKYRALYSGTIQIDDSIDLVFQVNYSFVIPNFKLITRRLDIEYHRIRKVSSRHFASFPFQHNVMHIWKLFNSHFISTYPLKLIHSHSKTPEEKFYDSLSRSQSKLRTLYIRARYPFLSQGKVVLNIVRGMQIEGRAFGIILIHRRKE